MFIVLEDMHTELWEMFLKLSSIIKTKPPLQSYPFGANCPHFPSLGLQERLRTCLLISQEFNDLSNINSNFLSLYDFLIHRPGTFIRKFEKPLIQRITGKLMKSALRRLLIFEDELLNLFLICVASTVIIFCLMVIIYHSMSFQV